jgi:hypothetical protein
MCHTRFFQCHGANKLSWMTLWQEQTIPSQSLVNAYVRDRGNQGPYEPLDFASSFDLLVSSFHKIASLNRLCCLLCSCLPLCSVMHHVSKTNKSPTRGCGTALLNLLLQWIKYWNQLLPPKQIEGQVEVLVWRNDPRKDQRQDVRWQDNYIARSGRRTLQAIHPRMALEPELNLGSTLYFKLK